MNLDFTLKTYARLCDTLKQLNCPVMTVRHFLETDRSRDFLVVLRHDVDRSLPCAIRMAQLEADYGIAATYYVRMTRKVFKPAEIKIMSDLGHEIGYHYEVLARAKGDIVQAMAIFEKSLAELRRVVPVDTISMHGSPLTPWNNLDLWKTHDYRDYDIKGEASLTIDYSRMHYFTDTGRSWDADRYNIRDRVPSLKHHQKIHSTHDLMEFLVDTKDGPVFINTHPNRWADTSVEWCIGTASDFFINQAKWIVSKAQQIF